MSWRIVWLTGGPVILGTLACGLGGLTSRSEVPVEAELAPDTAAPEPSVEAPGEQDARAEPSSIPEGFLYGDPHITSGLFTEGGPPRLVVLDADVDRGLVVYKAWPQKPTMGNEPVDCRYGGMAARPGAGVQLGVVDSGAGTVERWDVYASVTDPRRCTSAAESATQLAAAKKRVAELGLTVDRKPALIEPGRDQMGRHTLTLGGLEVVVGSRLTPVEPGLDDVEAHTLGSGPTTGFAVGTWTVDGSPRSRFAVSFPRAMGGTGQIAVAGGLGATQGGLLVVRGDRVPMESVWWIVPVR